MRIPAALSRLVAFAVLLFAVRALPAQPILVGNAYPFYGGQSGGSAVTTYVQRHVPATTAGDLTTVVFGWSASPCPAAVKIKFFHVFSGGSPV